MNSDITDGTAQLSLSGATTPAKKMILGYDTNGNGFGYIKAGNQGTAWTNLALQPNGGNVGIGTTNPVGGKVVSTSNAATLPNFAATAPGGAQGQKSGYSLYSTFMGTGDSGPRRTADIIAGFNGGAWGNEFLSFNVGNNSAANDAASLTSEKMRIRNDGNVGIGTATPAYKLDVNGGAYTSGGLTTAGNLVVVGTSAFVGALSGAFGAPLSVSGALTNLSAYNNGVTTGIKALYIDNTGKIGFNGSSQRFKENIKNLDDVSWLYSLRPVFYNYIEDKTKAKRYGLIAEEVDKINPAVVTRGNDGKIDTVFYEALISPIIKAIQDQKSEIDQLKAENAEIRSALCEIKPTLKLCR
jgi:hypothetical protein